MDEGGHQKDRLFGVAVLDELDRAVADPLRRVRFCGELAYLGNVVHVAALTVIVEDVLVGRVLNELGVVVIGMRKFFLRVAATEAHEAVLVPNMMHLTDTAGVKSRLCEHRVEALAVVADLGVVVRVAGAVDILTREKRESCGNANGGGGHGAVKNKSSVRDRIECGGLGAGIAVRTKRVCAALVGHDK